MSYDKELQNEMVNLFDIIDESMVLMEERLAHLRKRKFKKGMELSDALNQLLKAELVELAEEYAVLDASKYKKKELINTIATSVFEELKDRLLSLNTRHFEVLEMILNGKNAEDALFIESLTLLEEWGYAFSYAVEDELLAFVPMDVYDAITEIYNNGSMKEIAEINKDMVDYLDASLAYYGVARFEALGDQFRKLYGIKMDEDLLYQTMIMNTFYARNSDYNEEEDFFYNIYTDEPAELLEVVAEMPPESYKMMTRHLVEDYVMTERISNETSDQFKRLVIEKTRLDEDEVDLIVEEMEESVRHVVPLEEHYMILEEVFDFLDEGSLNELKVAFEEMYNDIPMWVYKGHSINEMNGKKKRHLRLV